MEFAMCYFCLADNNKKNMWTCCWIIVMECSKLVFKCSCYNKVGCSYGKKEYV